MVVGDRKYGCSDGPFRLVLRVQTSTHASSRYSANRYAFSLTFTSILTSTDVVAFPQHARSFNKIMQVANRQLRHVFGMEIVELRAKMKVANAAETLAATQKGKGKGRANQTQADGEEAEAQTQSSKSGQSANTSLHRCPSRRLTSSRIKHIHPPIGVLTRTIELDERPKAVTLHRT